MCLWPCLSRGMRVSLLKERQMLFSAADPKLNEIMPSGSSLITLIECLGKDRKVGLWCTTSKKIFFPFFAKVIMK